MFKYTVLIWLFASIFAQTAFLQAPEVKLDASTDRIIKCWSGFVPVSNEVIEWIAAIKEKDATKIINLVYSIIQSGDSAVLYCVSLVPWLEQYLSELIVVDWNDWMKCLLDTKSIATDVLNLVEVIISKDYSKALSLVYQLYLDGNDVITECIAVFKKAEEIRLRATYEAALSCWSDAHSSVSEVQELIQAVKAKNPMLIAILAIRLMKSGNEIYWKCKSFL